MAPNAGRILCLETWNAEKTECLSMQMDENSEETASKVRFVPNGGGLVAHFDFGALHQYQLDPGEHRRELMVATASSLCRCDCLDTSSLSGRRPTG
jgi:hypothetical protein